MADRSVDEPLKNKEHGDDGPDQEIEHEMEIEYPMKDHLYEYFYPELFYVFVQKRWGSISAITGLIYSIHLFFAIYGVDQFTDVSRLRKCTDKLTKEESSSVYQMFIGIAATFHIIEWLRQLVVLAITLIGSNITWMYYVLSINVLYGFVVMFVAFLGRFIGDGPSCAEVQSDRALYLALQIVTFLIYFLTCAHIHLFMWCKGKQYVHDVCNEPEEDSDEEEEDEDKED